MTSSITGTFSAILNTVATTANSVTKIVDAAASGLDMTEAYIKKARIKQEAEHAVEMADFFEELEIEATAKAANRKDELEKLLQGSQSFKKHYETENLRLKPIIDQVKTKYYPV